MNIETVVQLRPVLGLRWWSIEPSAARVGTRKHLREAAKHLHLVKRVSDRIREVERAVWEMHNRRRCPIHSQHRPYRKERRLWWYPPRVLWWARPCVDCGRLVSTGFPGSAHSDYCPCPENIVLCLQCGVKAGLPAQDIELLTRCTCERDFARAGAYLRASQRLKNLLTAPLSCSEQQLSYKAAPSVMLVPLGAGSYHDELAWAHPDGEAEADHPPTPEEHDEHGLYAYALAAYSRFLDVFQEDDYRTIAVGGLVALSGVIIEHADGVLRASHAQIREIYVVPRYPYMRRRARLMARQLQAHYTDVLVRVLEYPELVAHVRGLLLNES